MARPTGKPHTLTCQPSHYSNHLLLPLVSFSLYRPSPLPPPPSLWIEDDRRASAIENRSSLSLSLRRSAVLGDAFVRFWRSIHSSLKDKGNVTLEISFNYHALIRSFLLLRIKRTNWRDERPVVCRCKIKTSLSSPSFPLSLSLCLPFREVHLPLSGDIVSKFRRCCSDDDPRSPKIPFARMTERSSVHPPYVRKERVASCSG